MPSDGATGSHEYPTTTRMPSVDATGPHEYTTTDTNQLTTLPKQDNTMQWGKTKLHFLRALQYTAATAVNSQQ